MANLRTPSHELAVSNNPNLASQRQAVDVARFEVERNRAGHLPKVNLDALNAEQQLYTTRRDLAQARYEAFVAQGYNQ